MFKLKLIYLSLVVSNVISSATVSVKRSVSCSVLYSVLLRKQGVATFWSFESREVESRKIGKELHDSYYLLNSDLVFFSSLSWYQSFTHSHYLLSTVKLHWGGALAQLVECTSRVLRLYPQQWATVQVQPLALCCVSSHFLSSLWADWQCEEHLDLHFHYCCTKPHPMRSKVNLTCHQAGWDCVSELQPTH